MKADPRGPFAAIRWFCKDGRVLPPNDYACAERGSGRAARRVERPHEAAAFAGLQGRHVLAGVDAQKAVAAPDFPDTFAQLLIEKFLIATDDGWVLRKARFYRGAIQEEDEREAARDLLAAMAAREEWIGYRFPALRSRRPAPAARRRRGIGAEGPEHGRCDRRSRPAFQRLRAKIHKTPEASDAASVREYGAKARGSRAEAAGRCARRRDRSRLRTRAARRTARGQRQGLAAAPCAAGACCATRATRFARHRRRAPLRVTARLLAGSGIRCRRSARPRRG